MTNICHDLQILGHDPSFSVDRAATIFKDSSGVIRTECSKVLDQMKSFEDAPEAAIRTLTQPLVNTMKGFISRTRTILGSAEKQLLFAMTSSHSSGSLSTKEAVNAVKDSYNLQKDLEMTVINACRKMKADCLPVAYKDYRPALLELNGRYKALAKSIVESNIYSVYSSEVEKEHAFYKDEFLTAVPEILYTLIRLTFMFEAQDPVKLKDKLAGLPINYMEHSIEVEILAELKRDASYLTSERFTSLKDSNLYHLLEPDITVMVKDYKYNSELVGEISYLYLNMAQTQEKKAKEDMFEAFRNLWSSTNRWCQYYFHIEKTVLVWLASQLKLHIAKQIPM